MDEATLVETQEYKFDALQILRGATWFGVGSALGMGLEFVAQGLIAAKLGPADFGLLSVGLQVFMIAMTLAVLALPGAVTYFIPNSWAEEGSERAGSVVATAPGLEAIQVRYPFFLPDGRKARFWHIVVNRL